MRVTPVIEGSLRGGIKAAGERVRAIGNSSDSAQLGKERGAPPRDASRPRSRLQVELVCQAETKSHDPFWDGPRLTSAFVTQLLGQAIVAGPAPAAMAAYGKTEDKSARLFDTSF